MGRILGSARWLIALLALAMVATACGGGDEGEGAEEDTATDAPVEVEEDTEEPEADTETEAGDEPTETAEGGAAGGTVLFGDEQEPTILNSYLIDGNSLTTTKVVTNVLAGLYRVQPDLSTEIDMLAAEAEVTEDPFTVTYTLRDDLVWSDGEPITTEDLVFTLETVMAEENAEQITSTSGYELITETEVVDEQTVTFTFSEPYPAYNLLFDAVLPQHVLEGEDFLTVWNEGIVDPATGEGIASGPFIFEEWVPGQQIRLLRNEGYWGDPAGVDEIIMRYVGDTTTLTQAFRGGEINMFDPQPQLELIEALDSIDTATYEVVAGPTWEHIDFNHLVPGLDKDYVRQAIAYGINREEIVSTLLAPVQEDAEVLNNINYVTTDANYVDNWGQYTFDPEQAISILEENGCTRGDGDIFECDGDRLSFRISTTGGNQRRELTQQLIQASLAEVGIEITIENDEGATFFERLDTPENCGGTCDYDIALFAWVGTPDATSSRNIWGCDRPQNWTAYCNEEATALMDEAAVTIDIEEQSRLMNEADAIMAEEVPVLPLFQQPALGAWDSSIQGPQPTGSTATIFWNAGEWTIAD